MTLLNELAIAVPEAEKGLAAAKRVRGVGRVALGGSVTRQIQVRIDPVKLTAVGLTVDQVVAALRGTQGGGKHAA